MNGQTSSPGTTDTAQMLSMTALKERGWTATLIARHLGDPDRLAVNPHYRSGPKVRLYVAERVERTEQQDHVRMALQKIAASRPARQAAAKKAAQAKADALVEAMDRIHINVRRIDLTGLRKAAISDWERRKADRGDYDADGHSADEATLRRWMENYVRHRLTGYDGIIAQLFGLVGRDQAYALLRTKTDAAIMRVYPELRKRP